MDKTKKCYHCSTDADEYAKVCPKCNVKLGAKMESGIAGKPDLPLLKILFIIFLLAIAGKIVGHSIPNKLTVETVKFAVVSNDAKDGVIRKIKEKGSEELSALGVDDIGYKDDALCVYVDKRFNNMARAQQEQLVKIVANEWVKTMGKESNVVDIMEYGTDRMIEEWVLK